MDMIIAMIRYSSGKVKQTHVSPGQHYPTRHDCSRQTCPVSSHIEPPILSSAYGDVAAGVAPAPVPACTLGGGGRNSGRYVWLGE